MANMLEEAFLSKGKKKGESSKGVEEESEEEEEEILFPPKGFNVSKLEETQKYLKHFARRNVCKMHYINPKTLQEVLKFDLSEYLEPYMPWLSVKLPFCTKVVRHFYCNLEPLNDTFKESLEEVLVTKVRGQKLYISPSKINIWLGIENPPDDNYPNLDPNQIFSTLRPGEIVGPLNFNPSDMSDFHRVLWYIYSRALVNKSNNFTHFTDRDYSKFASMLLKEQKDLGEYIFCEIQRYMNDGKPTTPMPYPQLISLFLKKNKIWYLESKEPIERISPVGKNQIGKLKIEIPLRTPLESGPRKKKATETATSRMDDTQSSAPAGTSTPSFLNSTLQTFMENILRGFHIDISNTNAELVTHMNTKMGELVERMDKRHEEMLAEQRAQGELLRSIVARLDSMAPGSTIPGPSSIPEFTPPSEPYYSEPGPSDPKPSVPDPSEHILFSIPDPNTSEPIDITSDDPIEPEKTEQVATPIASPTHTEEVLVSSPLATEEVEITSIIPYQPLDLRVPPVNLPEPEQSSSHTSSSDDSHGSLVLPVKPISAVSPSSPP